MVQLIIRLFLREGKRIRLDLVYKFEMISSRVAYNLLWKRKEI